MDNLPPEAGPVLLLIGVIFAGSLLLALVIGFFIIRKAKSMMPDKKVLLNGELAQAKVLQLQDTGVMVNYNPQIQVLLEVHRANQPPYQVQVKQVVSQLVTSQYLPGNTIAVRVDPKNPKHVVLG